MRVPNGHVVFSPKNNFQELQLHQTSIFFWNFGTCQDHRILEKTISAIFKKIFCFNFICILMFFQKYTMSSVFLEIADILYFVIKLTRLAENFKAIAQ